MIGKERSKINYEADKVKHCYIDKEYNNHSSMCIVVVILRHMKHALIFVVMNMITLKQQYCSQF